LTGAELNKAYLVVAELNEAELLGAKLSEANLSGAELNKANLLGAELNKAYLFGTQLQEANMIRASVAGAHLDGADLTGARYAPSSPAPDGYVGRITGLETVTFPEGEEVGLVQLRDLLQKAGLRDLERQATFAIENGRTINNIANWRENPKGAVDGVFRKTAFDFTTRYGLDPARPLFIIVAIWALLIPVYLWPIWRQPAYSKRRSGIYRVSPKDRIEVRDGKPTLDNPARAERLHARGVGSLGWSAYFSLLSAFQIGFREFSVGTWLARAQPRIFALEATGWVRTVSGLQSLLSVYLLAMWLLTYFGRPFQ
jgi:Pentapeptide repeats (8 copies)